MTSNERKAVYHDAPERKGAMASKAELLEEAAEVEVGARLDGVMELRPERREGRREVLGWIDEVLTASDHGV